MMRMTNGWIKQIVGLAAAAVALSGCIPSTYVLSINPDGTQTGYLTSSISPEMVQTLSTEIVGFTPRSISALSFEFDGATCSIYNVVLQPSALTSAGLVDVAVYKAHMSSGQDISFRFMPESLDRFNNYRISSYVSIGTAPCSDPGTYVSGGQAFSAQAEYSTLGINRAGWDSYQQGLAVSNVPITDRPYLYALLMLGNPDGLTPQLSVLDSLMLQPAFASLPTETWVPGRFVTAINALGIKTSRTAAGWTVKVPLTKVPLNLVSASSDGGSMVPNPTFVRDSHGVFVTTLNYGVIIDGKGQEDGQDDQYFGDIPFAQYEFRDLGKYLQDTLSYQHKITVAGVILETNGTFNVKTNTVSLSWKGWGSHSTQTALNPTLRFVNGHRITMKSTSLDATAKKTLKNVKTALKAMDAPTVYVIRDGRITKSSKLKVHNKVLAKRAAAVKAFVKAQGVTQPIAIVYVTSLNNNSAVTKAAVDHVVVGDASAGIPT